MSRARRPTASTALRNSAICEVTGRRRGESPSCQALDRHLRYQPTNLALANRIACSKGVSSEPSLVVERLLNGLDRRWKLSDDCARNNLGRAAEIGDSGSDPIGEGIADVHIGRLVDRLVEALQERRDLGRGSPVAELGEELRGRLAGFALLPLKNRRAPTTVSWRREGPSRPR